MKTLQGNIGSSGDSEHADGRNPRNSDEERSADLAAHREELPIARGTVRDMLGARMRRRHGAASQSGDHIGTGATNSFWIRELPKCRTLEFP